MKLLPEDPRLTAYAHGEIEDPQEQAEIQSAVEASPELQTVVASIREMGDLLSAELSKELPPSISEFEKAKLSSTARPEVRKRFAGELFLHWPLVAGLAAACALAAVIWLPKIQEAPVEYAYNEPNAMHHEADQLRVDSSMKAVEDLETRTRQQGQVVEKLTQTIEEFEAKHGLPSDKPVSREFVNRPALNLPVSSPTLTSKNLRMRQVGNVAVASIDVDLPAKEESFTLSSGIGGGESKTGLDLLGTNELGKNVSVFGLKTKPEADYIARQQPPAHFNTESYDPIEETDFRSPLVAPLSTFSIDVDTASYANVRRFLKQGQMPPADAVRIEELINYFSYNDAPPTKSLKDGGDPFAVHMAQSTAPWNPEHRLLRIALKGYEMPWAERPASNLVFLLDVSGSMNQPNKLPLVKSAMDLLIRRLDERDRVAIVVYAGASGLALPSTTANNRETIAHALDNLKAGGSTNAGAGIELAYATARAHMIEGGNNRVILCTDGDFNVGQTNRSELAESAEAAADEGISLTVLGFGMHNYKDDMLETLSNKGKGSYAYIDSSAEARKVFLQDIASNLFKIAKDVKIQVEFNPEQVKAYRLIGYENRRLKAEDFNNDAKKAGDIGPGHSVVALYELVPVNSERTIAAVDPLRYQAKPELDSKVTNGEVATVKLRYKQPEGTTSQLITHTVRNDERVSFEQSNDDFRFTTAVAAFGLRLTGSEHIGDYNYSQIERIAVDALGDDPGGHRSEFTELVRRAETIAE
jgi:Ca-activated chloride channel family protein